ncbi:glycosyltransferase [Parazoarcus communis]|uniref:Glycosyltransferase n=1 Tax=Parazoarcus communis TaxID=41977 RepID=A0A2U8GT02_9RHOO|nr:glycosyltransferase [Parazoarcus communis]AWI76802.1 glycosyltransferase [Parazoarcus communis]
MKSLHIIGSKQMGGAERWFARFLSAMRRQGEDVAAIVRKDSELAQHHLNTVPFSTLPLRTVWDPLSKLELSRAIARSDAPIVQTYMGRATRLTHIKPGQGKVHVSRLGGYYKLDPFRHAHAWIGNTRGLCDWMIQGGLPANRVFHITNFADPARSVPVTELDALRRRLDLRSDDWLMLTAGRLIDVKGQRFLLEAMAKLPAQIEGRRLRLVMLGDGDLRGSLEQQARQLGIADRIIWAGWQHDPAPWFHLADMVAFPSRDAETLGNVILEAWAYARPLVATAFRGAREIARHGEDAWVVPCDDSDAIARGIETVMRDAELRGQMVAKGLARIRDDFSETAVITQYRSLYAQLLDNR